MAPTGLAILIGAGPNTGTGIARILSSPYHTNLAVALLARNSSTLNTTKSKILASNPDAIIETFPSSTSEADLKATFSQIRSHKAFQGLKLKAAIYSVKHSSKKPFLEETREAFSGSLDEYVGGAFTFAQESLKLLFEHNGEEALADGGEKKGTIIFTGTLGALRTNPEYAAYGAGRAGVRMLAQSLGRELSGKGVHVVHVIANGGITDEGGEDTERGKKMAADAVGRTYAGLIAQEKTLWTSELDMRPAQEKW